MGPDSGTCWMSLRSPWCVLCDWGLWECWEWWWEANGISAHCDWPEGRMGVWLEQCSNSQLMRGAKSSPNKRLRDWMREEQMQCGTTNLMEWHTTLTLTLDSTPTAPLWINNQAPQEDLEHLRQKSQDLICKTQPPGTTFFFCVIDFKVSTISHQHAKIRLHGLDLLPASRECMWVDSGSWSG